MARTLGSASTLAIALAMLQGGCGTPIDTFDAGGAPLQWFQTCGYPVCPAPDGGPGDAGPLDAGACPALGTVCTTMGETCGTPSAANCGVVQICASLDPRAGGCPVSSRQFKDNVQYLDEGALQHLHDELVRTKLATYRYKSQVADPDEQHLGFIIEDQPESPAVDREHQRVDLYGYLSMVVATLQVQEQELARLRHELDEERQGVCEPEQR